MFINFFSDYSLYSNWCYQCIRHNFFEGEGGGVKSWGIVWMKFNYHDIFLRNGGILQLPHLLFLWLMVVLSHYFLPSRVNPSSFEKENTIDLCYCLIKSSFKYISTAWSHFCNLMSRYKLINEKQSIFSS